MRVVAQLVLTFLLNASWQIALVVAFAAACDWLLRGTAARYRHALWIAALGLAFVLPLLGPGRLVKESLRAKPQLLATAAAPVFVTWTYSPDFDSSEPAATVKPAAPSVQPARRTFRSFLASGIHLNRSVATFLVGLYGLFLLFRASQLMRAWQRTKTIVQSAYECEFSGPAKRIIEKCQTVIGVRRVRFLCSASVPVPVTVGILYPLIILPAGLLQEVDEEVLTTAIGHELVHVARRDYLANLIYEFIYLPLSFHPAAALMRRRIKQTRELCCDETVTTKLLRAETYARSLVRLIGAAPLGRRLAVDTTIGISEEDILEVRIMSLLKAPKLTARRKRLLLITASLLLVAPCIAATAFALTLDIDRQEGSAAPQTSQKVEREVSDRLREELVRAISDLREKKRLAPQSQWPEIDSRLREVQQKLDEYQRQRPEAEARLREVQQNLELHNRMLRALDAQQKEKQVQELRETLAQLEKTRPGDESQAKELRAKIADMEKSSTLERTRELESSAVLQNLQANRRARVIYRADPEYPVEARERKAAGTVLLSLTIDHEGIPQNIRVTRALYPSLDQAAVECVKKWRFEPAMKDGQPVSQFVNVEVYFGVEDPQRQTEDRIKKEMAEREAVTVSRNGEAVTGNAFRGELEMKRRRDFEDQGREERSRRQLELTRGATLSMDRAIQIATSQVPGKVLACSLGRDGDKVFYHVVIIGGDGDKNTTTFVWVSATDGQILKTEKEERREMEAEAVMERRQDKAIAGGVLNGSATSLPAPVFPVIARAAHASGTVTVEITVSESGEVIAAHAVSGHPLLQAAAVNAARQASFKPTRLEGEPVKVNGVLVYNFAAQ